MHMPNIHKRVQLKPNEEILEVVHESLIPHAPKFAFFLLLFLLPFLFLFPLMSKGFWGMLFFFLLLIVFGVLLWRQFFKWANTMLIITDKRVIDMNQKALFDREVSEAPYGRIDDVSYRVKGIAATICRFGHVHVKMAGEAADIQFARVKEPARIHSLIQDLRKVLEDEARTRKEEVLHELADEMSLEEVVEIKRERESEAQESALISLYEDDHEDDA